MTREEAVKRLKEYAPQYSYGIYRNGEGDGIAFDMAIKALEQESKHGKWIDVTEYCKYLEEETGERYQPSGMENPVYCNQCWSGTIKKFDFCPNCRADMRGDEE